VPFPASQNALFPELLVFFQNKETTLEEQRSLHLLPTSTIQKMLLKIETAFMKKIRADYILEWLTVIQFRIFCLSV
jgi:hypothetical protein